MTIPENARSVVESSLATAMQRRSRARTNVAPRSVVEVQRLDGIEPVYNLSTSDGTFFANGVLVSNCDALRYLVFSEARSTGAVPESLHRENRAERLGVHLKGRGRDEFDALFERFGKGRKVQA